MLRFPTWRWTRRKCCAFHKKCNSSSDDIAKVSCWPRGTTLDRLRNASEWQELPHLPHATRNKATRRLKLPNLTSFTELTKRLGHTASRPPPADGCEQLRKVERTHPQPPDPRNETEPLLCVREKVTWSFHPSYTVPLQSASFWFSSGSSSWRLILGIFFGVVVIWVVTWRSILTETQYI